MTNKRGKRPDFKMGEVWEAKLEDIVPGSKLFDKYPELKNLKVGYKFMIRKPYEDKKMQAGYYYKTKRIFIECEDNEDFEYALQHEVDHAIKDISGGPRGGTIKSSSMPGTPSWERAKKKYQNLDGEKLAYESADNMHFEEYFQLQGYEKYEKKSDKKPERKSSISGLLKKLFPAFISLIFFIFALFCFYPVITGNIVLGSNIKDSLWLGVSFLFISLIFSFLWFRKK